jgi:hypothetical protein
MSNVECPECYGAGYLSWVEPACCGNYLPTGECCAAQYGTDRLVLEERGEPCGYCGGNGYVDA